MFFRNEFRFMSNFYGVAIETEKWGVWASAEHLYQACKFLEASERELIRHHPAKGLKRFCRTLGSMDPDWNKNKLKCMTRIVQLKFEQYKNLQYKLVEVEGRIVEENTWHDNYWGDCICDRLMCRNRRGDNHLGMLLMVERLKYINLLEV